MVRIRTSTEIVLSLIEFYRRAQPELDTKPGSAARDVLIDGPSIQLARLYEELRAIASLQSLRQSLGIDLDKIALNFGATRKSGQKAIGPALFTFNELNTDIAINQGDIATANNGSTFSVVNSLLITTVENSNYQSIATKYRNDLDLVGITDIYAAEVLLECTTTGIAGNISKYSLKSVSTANINNITNVFPFSRGKPTEDDATFRNRVFSIFSGANTGTALGYEEAAKSDASVIDAVVIEPGDTLMTRDGTQISTASDGTKTILSAGTGGKVDIIVFGTRLQETTDSYIYRDLSNTGAPTHIDNDHVLGQIEADVNKTIAAKRLSNLANEILPEQPVSNIVEVRGSLSGSNFVSKSVNAWGVITGNYELVRDTGAYSGSPWGMDKLRWLDNKISNFPEDKVKGTFNGQDSLSFTDLLEITKITQNISVVNENSTINQSDRSSIQLSHYPVTNVTRVFNVTTGERYVVTSQNPDGSGSENTTGRITISGQTLPAVSDILQVDYTWIFSYDPYYDFDNRIGTSNPRTVQDSVDWGFSNAVRRERVTLTAAGSYLSATVTHPISSVVSVNTFQEENKTITLSSGEIAVVVNNTITDVVSITRISDGAELWDTNDADGTFSSKTIFFPDDSDAQFGQAVTVVYNTTDVFNASTQGSFSSNVISVAPSSSAVAGELVECTYFANISTILPQTLLSSLPAIRNSNKFNTETTNNTGNQPTSHTFDANGLINKNLRIAPSNLALTISGSISNGVITLTGTTVTYVADAIITASNSGLTHDVLTAIKSNLGLGSTDNIPSNIRLSKIDKVEKVTTSSDLVVTAVENTYDIKGYKLYDNSFVKDESISDTSLSVTKFTLPSTPDNTTNTLAIGDRLRIRFHYIKTNDTENISFGKSGTLYTNKKFALVDIIAISSGFTSSQSLSAVLSVTNANQPVIRSRYKTYYNYSAPKSNERITIRYNYDKLITDVTLTIEDNRPVNADVLVKAATPILVDVTMKIVVTSAFSNSSEIVRQDVQDAITTALNSQELGTTIDQSDLINAAYSASGLDRARILYFNETGENGSALSITAEKNEYIIANNVTVTVETR